MVRSAQEMRKNHILNIDLSYDFFSISTKIHIDQYIMYIGILYALIYIQKI